MPEFAKQMLKLFNIKNSNSYICPFLSAIKHQPVLDILALDDELHKRHGEYEEQDKSMNDIVIEHYGEQAALFIRSNI